MRVIVTRPAQEAQRWVQRLRARGHDAVALPLLAIGPAPDPEAVRSAWRRLAGFGAVMFVSGQAVQAFFRGAEGAWPASGPRAWAPGPATAEALQDHGVPASRIDSPPPDAQQFDSETLWQRVQGQLRAGDRLLIVRGSGGREWLGDQLRSAGVAVDVVAAYSRAVPAWTDEERALARSEAVWLFSSSEAANNLQQLLPGGPWRERRAIATHPRIAQTVRALGFGQVQECRPAFDAVVASIESAG